jgi:hypothetical protein
MASTPTESISTAVLALSYSPSEILTVYHDEIRAVLLEVPTDSLPSRLPDHITQEKYCKLVILHILSNVFP